MSTSACASHASTLVVGAMYPTAGGQGPGGIDEYRGVQLAAALANQRGGVHGRHVRIELAPTDSAEAVPDAMQTLRSRGARVILGSYGSTMSVVAAQLAARDRVVFWETGAVGLLPQTGGDRVFRVAPTGWTLGGSAVAFVRSQLLPRLHAGASLRYGVAYVDDVYGRSVGEGAVDSITKAGTSPVRFAYPARTTDFDAIAQRIVDARIDVLVVGAYLEDGIALRRALVRNHVPLVANIGTSSSYCMPEFGRRLGPDAVGVFASDKPDGYELAETALRPDALAAYRWADDEYARRYHKEMSAPALAGFAGAWALFGHVLQTSTGYKPAQIAAAAHAARVVDGGLPNGSGLEFTPKGASGAENVRAASVIWEWVAPGKRVIVYPPAFATHPILPITPR